MALPRRRYEEAGGVRGVGSALAISISKTNAENLGIAGGIAGPTENLNKYCQIIY